MDWREEAVNKLLSSAWDEYVRALETGKKLELEAHYGAWVAKALDEAGISVDAQAA